jgi:hypothetical protein
MTWITRSALLFSALLCPGFITLVGSSFSFGVEPEQFTPMTFVRWAGLGALASAPLWGPALIPTHYVRTLRISRYISAALLLAPIYFFGGIVVHNVRRSLSGLEASPLALLQGVVLTSACVAGLILLLWPMLRSHVSRE